MKKTITAAAMAALLGVAANANAWWGPFGGWGPWGNGWGDNWFGDWFGNGGMDFNFSIHANAGGYGRGWNRYYGYYAPYWGYPYGAYGYPYAVATVPVAPAATAESK
jgi:hypothetical protein